MSDNPWGEIKIEDISNKDYNKEKIIKGINTIVKENIKETNKDHKNKEL